MTPEARDALLPAIAEGDLQAFASWLAGAEPRIRLSLRRFAQHVDTEAVLQETLLRVWQFAPRAQVDARGDSLLRLGVQIARNLAIDHLRRDQRLERAAREQAFADDEETTDAPADPLLRERIRDCVKELPKQPAAVLSCRLENRGGLPDETLAEQLGMQLNTFLKNFGRARRFLLECLERAGVSVARS
ncbi:MAG TPA: RNA polymerase sigma factor [Polyangiaceae bacterium]|nr:RNA polymerase sigma factor [Polyangiaceae bacterium]